MDRFIDYLVMHPEWFIVWFGICGLLLLVLFTHLDEKKRNRERVRRRDRLNRERREDG